MKIKIWEELAEAIGRSKLEVYGIRAEARYYEKFQEVNLARQGQKSVEKLLGMIEVHPDKKGAKTAIRDTLLWLRAFAGESVKPRSMEQFESFLRKKLLESGQRNTAEGRPHGVRLYKHDDERDVWQCYYIAKTIYKPEDKRRDYRTPAHTAVHAVYMRLGEQTDKSWIFYPQDIQGRTVEEALANSGLLMETAELRATYEARRDKFASCYEKIGKQYLARGIGTDDCDGNKKNNSNDSWYWRRTNSLVMDKNGEPSRVVIDLFYEEEKEHRRGRESANVDKLWWHNLSLNINHADDDADEVEEDLGAIDVDDIPEPEIPLHPYMCVFDMKRHTRLRLDVGQLDEYVYDNRLGDKLILPSDSRNLVEMLLAHKSQFRDIVHGKSGGAIILCAGVPGTGKTLTAEVYAEVMAKPLYTVQASQLGTDADELEGELLKTFARAARWGAIMLIDEADVYVHTRGDDLKQNAIVGVFLRVLEYYKGVLFLTTNRSDLVDDAIASRCVARIDYSAPCLEDQKAIWRVLSKTAGITIASSVIDQVAERYPQLTGRDVKNLLKLAKLVSDSRECPITLEVIRFVKRFKPTIGTAGEIQDNEPVSLPPMRSDTADADTEVVAGGTQAPSSIAEVAQQAGAALDRRSVVLGVFDDGAPHAPAEAREAVKKIEPDIHPNVVTNVISAMVREKVLKRLPSGLYQKAA